MFSNAQRLSSYSFIFLPVFPLFSLFSRCRALNSAELPFGETPGSERILRGSFAQFVPDAQFPRGVAVADYLEMAYLACMSATYGLLVRGDALFCIFIHITQQLRHIPNLLFAGTTFLLLHI